jgi:hypothetical protein
MKRYNINEDCYVILTPEGIEVMKKNDPVMAEFNFDPKTRKVNTQIWCLMAAFGEKLYNGGPLLFEYNNIYIRD